MRYIKIEDLLENRNRWGQGNELWKNSVLKKDFRDFFHNKCWYTEVPLVGQDVHIDHFRPKAAVKPFENFKYNHLIQNEGYYWLANNPSNYRACCICANRKTGGGGKGSYFPLENDSMYQSETSENNEQPLLLDPCIAEDVKLLSFWGNRVVPATNDELGKERVRVSASIYNLTDAYISNERGRIWASIEKLLAEYASGDISKHSCIRQLRDAISPEAPFSACAISCVQSLAPDNIKEQLDLTL